RDHGLELRVVQVQRHAAQHGLDQIEEEHPAQDGEGRADAEAEPAIRLGEEMNERIAGQPADSEADQVERQPLDGLAAHAQTDRAEERERADHCDAEEGVDPGGHYSTPYCRSFFHSVVRLMPRIVAARAFCPSQRASTRSMCWRSTSSRLRSSNGYAPTLAGA